MKHFLWSSRQWIDQRFLEQLKILKWHPELEALSKHVLLNAGKALRPALLFWAYQLKSGEKSKPPEFLLDWALAVEMIHTYSLVHDDLPAMDNDSMRRGRPTVHVLKDDATAILLGDALLTGAFEVMARSSCIEAKKNIAMLRLAQAAGGAGMVSGQLRDMAGPSVSWALEQTHREKTGALMGVALFLGVLGAYEVLETSATESAYAWGTELGFLFQMADDILDYTGSSQELGKTAGKDLYTQKSTLVSEFSLEKAKQMAANKKQSLLASFASWHNETPQSKPSVKDLLDFVYL